MEIYAKLVDIHMKKRYSVVKMYGVLCIHYETQGGLHREDH